MKKSNYFTILELLLVMVIFLVLVALLLPIMTKQKEKAKRVECVNKHRQIFTASILYAKDFDKHYQPAGNWVEDWRPSMLYIMYQDNHPHYGADINKPANLGLLIQGNYLGSWSNDVAFRCPSNQWRLDSKGNPDHFNYYAPPNPLGEERWVNTRADYMKNSFYPNETRWQGVKLSDLDSSEPLYADQFSFWKHITKRHKDGLVVHYADGSAKYIFDNSDMNLAQDPRNYFGNNEGIRSIWENFKEQH